MHRNDAAEADLRHFSSALDGVLTRYQGVLEPEDVDWLTGMIHAADRLQYMVRHSFDPDVLSPETIARTLLHFPDFCRLACPNHNAPLDVYNRIGPVGGAE